MSRPNIPAEIRRAVLVEAGHRCAIPRCGQTELDIHHIVPWEICKAHEYSNLIALCPVCHRRSHSGDIDRKALFIYKEALVREFDKAGVGGFVADIVEIKRRIHEECLEPPGYFFRFDFPDFPSVHERIISKNIEAWGYELLVGVRDFHGSYVMFENPEFGHPPSKLEGDYSVVRRDSQVVSVRYSVDRYYTGNAHGGRATRVLNYLVHPFCPLTLDGLIGGRDKLPLLADLIRGRLSELGCYDERILLEGTIPIAENFSLFNIGDRGIEFVFREYQVAGYPEGEQYLWIAFEDLYGICDASVLSRVVIAPMY